MKGTYHFAANLQNQRLILDERKLYVQRGAAFEVTLFANEQAAAVAFNDAMKTYFNPRDGWQITKKEMGVAVAPADKDIIGQQTPPPTIAMQRGRPARDAGGNAGFASRGRPEAREQKPSPKAAKPRVEIAKTLVHVSGDHLLINVDAAGSATTRHALVSPATTSLCLYAHDSTAAALTVLKRSPLPQLQTFVVDCFDKPLAAQAGCEVGDLGAMLAAHPSLKRVYVVGDARFDAPIVHDGLQRLSLVADPLSMQHLRASTFSALRSIELALSIDVDVDDDSLDGVIELVGRCPVLDTVSLSGRFDVLKLIARLAAPGVRVPPRLQLLGRLDDEAAFVAAVTALAGTTTIKALAVPEGALSEAARRTLKEQIADVSGSSSPFSPIVYGIDRFLR